MRFYPFDFSPISFHFSQTPRDFVVQEIPLYPFSGSGEHLIVQVRKKGLSTQEMIGILCGILGCKNREIGYAGLKDKQAMTTQFLSLPLSYASKISQSQSILEQKNIKILSSTQHQNKLRIGHLKGNSFFIRLKKILPSDHSKIKSILDQISREGIPNYFGFQRFGKFGDNYLEGKKIAHQEKKFKNFKLNQFLLSSYQSHLFNQWLSQRIKFCKILQNFGGDELLQAIKSHFHPINKASLQDLLAQKHFFKLLPGDLLHHYPQGKLFAADGNLIEESKRFDSQNIVPCGVLCGKKITLSSQLAMEFQKDFLDSKISEIGSHRFAWVFPQNLSYRFIEEKAQLELSFVLPKGSYATILLETLANQEIKGGDDV